MGPNGYSLRLASLTAKWLRLGGLEAGMVVLIGAENAGIAYTATQRLPRAGQGLGSARVASGSEAA